MGGEGIEEEIVSKSLEDEKRAANKWVVVREVVIVPNQLAGKRRSMDEEGNQQQQKRATPVALQIAPEPGGEVTDEAGLGSLRSSERRAPTDC